MMDVALTFHGERKDSLVHGLGKTGSVYRGKTKKLDSNITFKGGLKIKCKDKTMRLLEKSRSDTVRIL